MEGEYDFADKSEQEVLLSYVAHKGHRTRYVNKIASLLDLQEAKYSKVTEATLLGYVQKMELHQDRLNIFAAWLTLHELESAEVHSDEAENLAVDTSPRRKGNGKRPQLRTPSCSGCRRRSRPSSTPARANS